VIHASSSDVAYADTHTHTTVYNRFLSLLKMLEFTAARYACAIFATVTCPSVRLSHAGIVPSRVKAGS